MDKGEYTELQEKFEDLQRQYDELRIVVARAGIPLPPEEHKRPALTLIKGGLAAIVGALGLLLASVRRHPAIAGTLVASVTALGVVVATLPPAPHQAPPVNNAIVTTPLHRHARRRFTALRPPGRTPSVRPSTRRRSAGGSTTGHRARKAHSAPPTLPQTQPQPFSPEPSPTPTPKPAPQPSPSPTVSVSHSKHCLVYAVILGQKVCVKFGLGVTA